jgi:hypothetical protein
MRHVLDLFPFTFDYLNVLNHFSDMNEFALDWKEVSEFRRESIVKYDYY